MSEYKFKNSFYSFFSFVVIVFLSYFSYEIYDKWQSSWKTINKKILQDIKNEELHKTVETEKDNKLPAANQVENETLTTEDIARLGQIGDMFGASNSLCSAYSALFSFAAVVFLIIQNKIQQLQIDKQISYEKSRDKYDDEKLLIDLSIQYINLFPMKRMDNINKLIMLTKIDRLERTLGERYIKNKVLFDSTAAKLKEGMVDTIIQDFDTGVLLYVLQLLTISGEQFPIESEYSEKTDIPGKELKKFTSIEIIDNADQLFNDFKSFATFVTIYLQVFIRNKDACNDLLGLYLLPFFMSFRDVLFQAHEKNKDNTKLKLFLDYLIITSNKSGIFSGHKPSNLIIRLIRLLLRKKKP